MSMSRAATGSSAIYAESPVAAKLSMLHSRLESASRARSPERAPSPTFSRTGREPVADPAPSSNIEAQLAESRAVVDAQSSTLATQAAQIADLTAALERLQSAFESEEATRRTLNSSFAKNFAMKIEERFLKLESALTAHKRALANAEEARVHMLHSVEARFSELGGKLDGALAAADRNSAALAALESRFADHSVRMDAFVAESTADAESRNADMWTRLKEEFSHFREELDRSSATRRAEDEERLALINDGIAFCKDGKETMLRLVDYKLLPFKLAREEAETKTTQALGDLDRAAKSMASRIQRLEQDIAESQHEHGMSTQGIEELLSRERAERERNEETVATILEMLSEQGILELPR
jgi:hypothetical protein